MFCKRQGSVCYQRWSRVVYMGRWHLITTNTCWLWGLTFPDHAYKTTFSPTHKKVCNYIFKVKDNFLQWPQGVLKWVILNRILGPFQFVAKIFNGIYIERRQFSLVSKYCSCCGISLKKKKSKLREFRSWKIQATEHCKPLPADGQWVFRGMMPWTNRVAASFCRPKNA